MQAMPALVHSHLAALGQPLRIVHVGPVPWRFPIAAHLDYRHVARLSPPDFYAQLTAADLFLTANAASVTLTQAVLAGVPSLLLQNHKVLDVARLARAGSAPAWLTAAAPDLTVAYPFRVYPWGWHEFLTPVLTDNPYTDCFLSAGVFERAQVLRAMSALLYDVETRARLRDRQWQLQERLALLPPAAEALSGAAIGS
jgi:hypothetical protein